MPGVSGGVGCQRIRRSCYLGLAMSMDMPPGRRGLVCSCQPGTTRLWVIGSLQSGGRCLKNSGAWALWGRSKGDQGRGFWLGKGLLCVVRWGVWPAWGAGMRRSDLSVDTKWWCWLVLDLSEIYVSDDWNLMTSFPFLTAQIGSVSSKDRNWCPVLNFHIYSLLY